MYNIPILLVDDDTELLKVYKKIFTINGFNVLVEADSQRALKTVETTNIAVVISDIIMPKLNGLELLLAIKVIRPNIEVIMLTAEGSISGAVEAVKNGAFSYLKKPVDIDDLIANIKKAYEIFMIKEENCELKLQITENLHTRMLIGQSEKIISLCRDAEKIAKSDVAVLILGESGTGKEVLANFIHQHSLRKEKPFICINCAALNENLFESELFGYEKGAFTGADKIKKGRFELAAGGTIFLDEIGELSLNTQAKLLRVLQEKSFERVGGTETISSNFRLIAATNRDLKSDVKDFKFREDLYYRINVMPLTIPPLRERMDDIPILVDSFVRELSIEMKKKVNKIDVALISILMKYQWPGNVRELRNVMERLVVLSNEGRLLIQDLPDEISGYKWPIDETTEEDLEGYKLKNATKEFEKQYIIKCMDRNEWNVSRAAQELGLARKNLYKKLKEYEIT
ncbi:sigma-54-dependent transcriptional regulator [Aminipila sp.]|uniref:sigma-54-dependent transcriptional regulator n=1 Tax=Aminipila sp. TaxID=2060095 RepID=UPI00289F27D4|nr:sigma-54 dependent transcriptional regulator [Aminipila sp.]